ncbi:MAG TPA: hypothetical protein PKV72_06605 [Candidatus Peribacteria bacterium]|nr:hypothetical protein [Candidatus Peribacteria bacterium]
MKTFCTRAASLGVSLALLSSASVAMAVEAPAVSDQGWKTLESLFNEALHSAAQSGTQMKETTVSYANRLPSVFKSKRMTKRFHDANVWARQVIRGKTNEARRMQQMIAAEKVPAIVAQTEKLPSRERLVRSAAAKLPNQCSALHTHDRSRCMYEISLNKRNVPVIFAAIGDKIHAAAR